MPQKDSILQQVAAPGPTKVFIMSTGKKEKKKYETRNIMFHLPLLPLYSEIEVQILQL